MPQPVKTKPGALGLGSGFVCQECGYKFKTLKAADRASYSDSGCPKCGGSDIDVGPHRNEHPRRSASAPGERYAGVAVAALRPRFAAPIAGAIAEKVGGFLSRVDFANVANVEALVDLIAGVIPGERARAFLAKLRDALVGSQDAREWSPDEVGQWLGGRPAYSAPVSRTAMALSGALAERIGDALSHVDFANAVNLDGLVGLLSGAFPSERVARAFFAKVKAALAVTSG